MAGQSSQELGNAVRLCQAAMDQGAMQKPEEFSALIELLRGERLATVVEIGTGRGGTLLVWCRLAAPDATIVSIDLPGGPFGGGYAEDQIAVLQSFAGPGQAVHLLRMDSGRQGTRQELRRVLEGRQIDLLFIDGDHTYYGVRTDFLLYAPLVRDGGLIVFHDLNSRTADPHIGVDQVWQQLKPNYEWREIVHHDPPPTFGGFGVLRWAARQEIPALDPSPDGAGFAVPAAFSGPPSEPAVDVRTAAGSLLLPRGDRVITQLLSDSGVWQPAETAYLQATLRPGQTFVDVGAHVGYFSVLASKLVGPTGTVIAVEPESRNLELLRRNLARNGCTNTLVVPFAARSTRGWLSPARDEANRGSHRLMRSGEPGTMVRCVRLDDLLPSKVDVVKIDAQGYDHDVVEGLERTFLGNPQLIVIAELATNELERIGVDPAWVLARYEALGYDLSIFDQELRLRRVARERVLALHQPRKHPLGFSVVLSRAEKPRFSGGRGCPAQVDGLEVDETSDGLTVFQPVRDQVHQLNLSAAIVFELCTGENSPAEITELVHKIYRLPDLPADEVARCLDRLWQEGLVM